MRPLSLYHVTSSRAVSSLLHSSLAVGFWKRFLQLEQEVVCDGEYLVEKLKVKESRPLPCTTEE